MHQSINQSIRYLQYHNWRRHFSHSYLNYQVPNVSSEVLLLSRSFRCELFRLRCNGHGLLLSSYLHRISRKENSACSACGHPLQDLNHLLLDCPAYEPLRKSIFGSSLSILDPRSRPWGVARTAWSPRSSSAPPSLGRGQVVPPPLLPIKTFDSLDSDSRLRLCNTGLKFIMEVYTNKVFTNLKKSIVTLTQNFDKLDKIH